MIREPIKDDMVDIALADSFPASDPPFFMADAVIVGSPPHPDKRRAVPKESTGRTETPSRR